MGKATRAAFGEALVTIGETRDRVVVIDADLSCSTQPAKFAEAFPARFIPAGIAEGNMVGLATGLALTGFAPFAASFACFIAGRFEQIRVSVAYNNANVTIVGTHSGVGIGEDGYSQMGLEDVGLMRTLPNMVVIQPADATETKHATAFLADYVGPAYLRLTRQSVPDIYDERYSFEFGKGAELREGSDLTIVASGAVVSGALAAAEELSREGLGVGVVNIHTIKPIDTALLAEVAARSHRILTVEDHAVVGGLGSAVVEALAETPDVAVRVHGVHGFGESGTGEDLYRKHLLDAEGIAKVAREFLVPAASARASA